MEMHTNLVPERDDEEEEDCELGDLLRCLEESPLEREPEWYRFPAETNDSHANQSTFIK